MHAIEKLYDAAAWADPAAIHTVFKNLRNEAPVYYHEQEGFIPVWHISKHADIFEVESNLETFINAPRVVLAPIAVEDGIRAMTGGSVNFAPTLVSLDRPRHTDLRLLTQAWFMPKNLARLQDGIDGSINMAFEQLKRLQGDCDFAKDVSVDFPLRVIMKVLGVPKEDYSLMLRLTQELFGRDDPDMKRDDGEDLNQALMQNFMEFAQYFNQLTASRRENPTDDVASIIANAEVDGQPLSDLETIAYYIVIATAGHDTTSYSLSEAVYHLAKNPDLFSRLKKDPQNMAKKITEEAIRYASPVRHFLRTATRDYELRGQQIKKDDTLIMWYLSGSRDEDLFENPDEFYPERVSSKRHAAFGHGAHMCLGMHLARQEITSFLIQLAQSVESIELTGEPTYTHALVVGGMKSLPIRVQMAS